MGNNLNCARACQKKSRKTIATCDGTNKNGTPCKAELDENQLFCKICGKCSNMRYFDQNSISRPLCRHLNEDLSYCRQCGIKIKTISIEAAETNLFYASGVQFVQFFEEPYQKVGQKKAIIKGTEQLHDDRRMDDENFPSNIIIPEAQTQPNESQRDDDNDNLAPNMIEVEEKKMLSAADGEVHVIKDNVDKRNAEWKNIIIPEAQTQPNESQRDDDNENLAPNMIEVEEKKMLSAAKGGVLAIKDYVDKRNAEWKKNKLHIGVTGETGAGKSAFVNSIRGGVKKEQYGYAPVDVKETTSSLKPYKHPQNESLIFWDMPGVGTSNFPKKEYLEKVKFKQYEFFVILSAQRFTSYDLWLAEEVKKRRMSFVFIRTKIDVDICNDKKENGEDYKDDLTLEKVRNDIVKRLREKELLDDSDHVFLIDNYSPEMFDFKKLVDYILKRIPDDKTRDSMALSLTIKTENVITAKKAALQKRIYVVALGSAAVGTVPIPGFGAMVDMQLMSDELAEYKRQFGLNGDKLLAKFSDSNNSEYVMEMCKKYSRNIAQVLAALAVDETLESKFAVPFVGSIIPGGISYTFCVAILRKMLNEMADDALQLSKQAIMKIGTGV